MSLAHGLVLIFHLRAESYAFTGDCPVLSDGTSCQSRPPDYAWRGQANLRYSCNCSFNSVDVPRMMCFHVACFTCSINCAPSSRTVSIHPRVYPFGTSTSSTTTATNSPAFGEWKTSTSHAVSGLCNIKSTIIRRLHGTSAPDPTTVRSGNV